jgi:hypothetical protein
LILDKVQKFVNDSSSRLLILEVRSNGQESFLCQVCVVFLEIIVLLPASRSPSHSLTLLLFPSWRLYFVWEERLCSLKKRS